MQQYIKRFKTAFLGRICVTRDDAHLQMGSATGHRRPSWEVQGTHAADHQASGQAKRRMNFGRRLRNSARSTRFRSSTTPNYLLHIPDSATVYARVLFIAFSRINHSHCNAVVDKQYYIFVWFVFVIYLLCFFTCYAFFVRTNNNLLNIIQ